MLTIKKVHQIMADHYFVAALWSSTFTGTDGEDEYFDAFFSLEDVAPITRLQAERDCAVMLQAAVEVYESIDDSEGEHPAEIHTYVENLENLGHDFWLTRNGHGTGFWDWDRGLSTLGQSLTNIAEKFGEIHLYVGDDGKVYAK